VDRASQPLDLFLLIRSADLHALFCGQIISSIAVPHMVRKALVLGPGESSGETGCCLSLRAAETELMGAVCSYREAARRLQCKWTQSLSSYVRRGA
jgi:hypothetical protein